jgi:hypothetical protein
MENYFPNRTFPVGEFVQVSPAFCYKSCKDVAARRQKQAFSGAADKRVGLAFASKGAFRPMAGDEHCVVAHGPQALGDAVDQRGMVTLRKIGAPDRAGKQHVPDKGPTDLRCVKHHMPRRVARAMAHMQGAVANAYRVTVEKPACGGEAFRMRQAKALALLGQAVNPELVARMRADDWQAKSGREFLGAARMVDVGMGQPDLFQRQPQLTDGVEQQVQVATGIDDGGLEGFVAPDKRAVLLESGDRNGQIAKHEKLSVRVCPWGGEA